MSTAIITPVSGGRRRKDALARGLLLAATLVALVPLVLVIFYLLERGLGAISWHFFASDPTGAFIGDPGGIRSAILGTIEMVALATLIAVPIGIGVALYLVEYGRKGRFASVVRYFVDVMTGVPSIVFGLFVYLVLVLAGVGGGFAGWKGSVALALLMLPIVTRSSEVALELVPPHLREAALALGAPRWRVVTRIVLPTALPGLVTGALLSIARAAGETAPLLFTCAIAGQLVDWNPTHSVQSIPLTIFQYSESADPTQHQQAWAAAFVLIVFVLVTSLAARLLLDRSRRKLGLQR
jgi:phosphate transport system permease protein